MTLCTKANWVLSVLVLTAIPIWAKPNISHLAYQCNSLSNQNACRELAKIAEHDKDPTVRTQAISSLTDQTLLAKITLEDKDQSVRGAAVEKLTDQALLARIALEDGDQSVRKYAVGKLTDQVLLGQVALEDKDEGVRKAAVGKLTDQPLLARTAVETKDSDVRNSAMRKLTDQALLAKIALEDKDDSVRIAAVGKLTDRSLLATIAAEDKDDQVRSTARQRLENQQAQAQAQAALVAALRQAGLHIFDSPTDKDPIRRAANKTDSGTIYLSPYGMVEARFLDLTAEMASYLDGKEGLACMNGADVTIDHFNKSLIGKSIIVFYLNIARTPTGGEDMGNRQMALIKVSDETPLPFFDPSVRLEQSVWDALLSSCQRIKSGAYLGPDRR